LGDVTIIDARGHRCPVPALRLRRALEAAAVGDRLRLVADDPMAAIDVPLLVKQCGYHIDLQSKTGANLIFEIVKSPAETTPG
jgi:tRNA 2-thiouridine synthesizing protein A